MIGTEVMVMCNGTYTLTSPNMTNTSAPYNSSENYNTIQCMQMDMYKHQTPYVVEAFVEPWIFAIGLTTNILSFSVLYHMPIVPSLRIVLLTLCVSDSLASVFGFMYIILEVRSEALKKNVLKKSRFLNILTSNSKSPQNT